MTRRERLENRAEKRREWAGKQEARAEAAHERVSEIADGIPFGQPILVGHHSEGRARRDQSRIESGLGAAIDASRKASDHASAADGIERQLATSIFDDDEDAVERLEAKVAELEAERDERKKANADYRRDHKAELAAMTPFQRSQAVPYPTYSLSNLSGRIRDAKQRIERLGAEQAVRDAGGRGLGREMDARFGGTCADCGGAIAKGERMLWFPLTKEAVHPDCPSDESDDESDEVDAILADAARTFYGDSPEVERVIEAERQQFHGQEAR